MCHWKLREYQPWQEAGALDNAPVCLALVFCNHHGAHESGMSQSLNMFMLYGTPHTSVILLMMLNIVVPGT